MQFGYMPHTGTANATLAVRQFRERYKTKGSLRMFILVLWI